MRTSVSSATSVRISMKMLLVGAVGMLALQALLIGGLLSMDSLDSILLNPDDDLSKDGISVVMLCRDGMPPGDTGSEVLDKMPPTGT
jgi:hypothetical protein